MKLYATLAWDAMRKNRRLCTPYLLACSGAVMMFYLIHHLAALPALTTMSGGRTTAQVLGFGTWIVALFALIFLFYTNSFLMRRRRREFGLYNILGMGKRELGLVLLCENVITLALALGAGCLGGVLLSKLAELGLLRALGEQPDYRFTLSADAFWDTVFVFALIFALILFKNLRQLRAMSAVALLRSESTGERPPRTNYLVALAGAALLAAAYAIAVSITNPLAALAWFFVAVGMVVVATYLLFIAGSVALCRLLQKNKRYYYRKNHFVSVSSMVYRMKRNGAGLASICILSTMVLVMMLGAGSLFFGKEESLLMRYPFEMGVYVDYLSWHEGQTYAPEKVDALLSALDPVLDEYGANRGNEQRYLCTYATGLLRGGTLTLDPETVNSADLTTLDDVSNVCFIPLADYNRCMGTDYTLSGGEALIYCLRRSYEQSSVTMTDGTTWRICGQLERMMIGGSFASSTVSTVFFVVDDLSVAYRAIGRELGREEGRIALQWYFDTGLDTQGQSALGDALYQRLRALSASGEGGFYSFSVDCRAAERSDFYATFGGIFFLGLFLSALFLAATVLILYYKQITEGYEDESRFAILRKVGMTRREIRQSVSSQMLTVFALPLLTAGLHTCFAFPMVRRLLLLFNLSNTALMLSVLAGAMVVFGAFYAAAYRLTSNVYCGIVSGTDNND